MYFVYLVRCKDGSLYCGQTTDLDRRIKEHNSQTSKSAKYLRGKTPIKLVHSEQYNTLSEALSREADIKRLNKTEKENLIINKTRL